LRMQLRAQQARNGRPETCNSPITYELHPKAATPLDSGRHSRWRVAIPDRVFEVRTAPALTDAEMSELYPGAAFEPMPNAACRGSTPAESAELRDLVRLVLADAPHEWDEVYRIACADPEAALTSFRLLADEARDRAIWGRR